MLPAPTRSPAPGSCRDVGARRGDRRDRDRASIRLSGGGVSWPLWGYTPKIRVLTVIGGLVAGVPRSRESPWSSGRPVSGQGSRSARTTWRPRWRLAPRRSASSRLPGQSSASPSWRPAQYGRPPSRNSWPPANSRRRPRCCTEPSSPGSSCWSTVRRTRRSRDWACGSATTISPCRRCRRRARTRSRAGSTGARPWRPSSSSTSRPLSSCGPASSSSPHCSRR
jgi:hypothetical protein